MTDFPSLRKEVYLQSFSGLNDGGRSSYESLFDYIINDDNLKKTYKEKFIDCLLLSSKDHIENLSLKEYFTFPI